jgi:hypothetical protein
MDTRAQEFARRIISELKRTREAVHSIVGLLKPSNVPVTPDRPARVDTPGNQDNADAEHAGPQRPSATSAPEHKPATHNTESTYERYTKRLRKAKPWVETIGVLVLIVYTVFSGCQSAAIREANRISEQHMVTSQRAFISFVPTSTNTFIGEETHSNRFDHMWKNIGSTPTNDATETTGFMIWSSGSIAKYSDFGTTDVLSRKVIVGPGQTKVIAIPRVSDEVLSLVKSEESRLSFWGFIVYSDIFQGTAKRLTEFCVVVADWEPRRRDDIFSRISLNWHYSLCPEHNCYDQNCKDYEERVSASQKPVARRTTSLPDNEDVAMVPGAVARVSSDAPWYRGPNLNDGKDVGWGSQETMDDTYAGVEFKERRAIREFRIQLFSPAEPPRSHLRDIRVFWEDDLKKGETPTHFVKSRIDMDPIQPFSPKVVVPPGEDGQIVRIEIDTSDRNYGSHKIWGFACLSKTQNDKRNYLPPLGGKGIYIRELQMK